MSHIKVLNHGNSQFVEIPEELAYKETNMDMIIERIGDELRVRPAHTASLDGVLKKFARFSPDFLAEGRGLQEQDEREEL